MTRSAGRVAGLEAAGASAVVCDALDRDQTVAAVAGAKPDAIIHHLTDLSLLTDPKLAGNPRRLGEAYELNDRLRTVGTANLVAAGEAAGAERIVAQSISFAYGPGPGLRSEDDGLNPAAPSPFDESVRALTALEDAVVGSRMEGLVLRFGFWYGPGTGFARNAATGQLVAKRRYPIVGRGGGVFSFVHIDDVVEATVAALERGAPGIYNVVDDDPAPMREWLPAYAQAIGAKPPRKVPLWIARFAAGSLVAFMATQMPGVSNEKAKRELGFQPRWPSWRAGFQEALG